MLEVDQLRVNTLPWHACRKLNMCGNMSSVMMKIKFGCERTASYASTDCVAVRSSNKAIKDIITRYEHILD
ncbi:hypothetical protein HNQ40_000917 [Algisphaera agarilytica]|uniref:Uncharacterized protein n=1 Tax=Algisphaera agarilytica TaxID=1385975 RepID=A0A7X0H6N9_9BACT|nr:hypothetical protein [Algisphaera agarilytica]